MKKKTYQKPTTEVTDTVLPQLLAASPGWSQDEGNVIDVGKEDGVGEEDKDSLGYGGFLDLD